MDDLLQRALQQRERLRAELEAVDNFIATYSRIKESAEPAPTPLYPVESGIPLPQSRAQRQAAVQAQMDAAEHMILQEGRPLTRGELVERLQAQGHALEGGDKSKVLGTNLWRSGRFHNLKGAGYWPKISPVPRPFATLERRATMIE